MTPKQFYRKYRDSDKTRLERLCKDAETSLGNFQQIAVSGGHIGKKLAKRLAEASGGEMSILEILYPEDYEGEENAA